MKWQNAISLDFKINNFPSSMKKKNYQIRVEKYYDNITAMSAGGEEFLIPAVMVKTSYVKHKRIRVLTKRSVLARDSLVCQYCRKQLNRGNATIDHVIPRSAFRQKSDANTWENLVACCHDCNNRKGARTPSQAKMSLIRQPVAPIETGFAYFGEIPDEWKNYGIHFITHSEDSDE